MLKSFAAPEASMRDDEELLRERVGTTVTSLLGLLGIDADPFAVENTFFFPLFLQKPGARGAIWTWDR